MVSLFSKRLFLLFVVTAQLVLSQEKVVQEMNNSKWKEYFTEAIQQIEVKIATVPQEAGVRLEALLEHEELKKFPFELARAQYFKGKLLLSEGNFKKAVPYFEKSINLPEQENFLLQKGNGFLNRAIAYSYIGASSQAQKDLEQSKTLFERIDNYLSIAEVFHQQGYLYYQQGEDEDAMDLYDKSLKIYEDHSNAKGVSDNYFRMALVHLGKGNDEEALELLVRAKDIKERIEDKIGLAKVKISLGVMYEENDNPKTAIRYYLESLEANKATKDARVNSIIFNNLGVAYTDLKKYDSALTYHNKALDFRENLGKPRGIIQSMMNIGEVYQTQKDDQAALDYFKKARELSLATEGNPMLPGVADRLGELFLEQGKLDSASLYLKEALRTRDVEGNYFSQAGTYNRLSQLEEQRGNFKQALLYHKLFKKVRDSSSQIRTDKELAEVQAKYDTERQQREIGELQQENEKRTLWRNIFAVGAVLAIGIAILVFQFFRYRSKKNKELLATKEEQHKQLKELDQMKSRFFSNISHEFRTPLTLILGPIDQLKKDSNENLHTQLNMIERNGNRLLKLINQLLDLSKIESGKITLKTALIDIVPLLKGITMSFNSVAETKSIALSFTTDQDTHFIYVDNEKIEQVIVNLLSNAFKYTSDGGRITVSVKKQVNDNTVVLSVSDTGTGIPEEEIPYIFDRFYQASNADTEDVTGTGIGLALIKELVELHKGNVKAVSTVNEGTTFEVQLPMGREHLSDEEISGIRKPQKELEVQETESKEEAGPVLIDAKTADGHEKPLVLVIEDNQDLRTYIRDILKTSYDVIDAVNGKDGVEKAKEHIPDIIISDLMMPKMDGLEVCKYLKEEMLTSHIPIILLTAKSSKEDRLEGLKSLADDYLTKPFDTEELLVRLNNLIALREKMQAKFKAHEMLSPKKVEMSSLDAIFMEKVTKQLEKEIANTLFGVVELAYAVGLSRSQLFRKVKAITNLTPNEYIRSFRLHRAMDILKQEGATVSQVAYETGFQNPSYFSKCFQEQFGMAPSSISKQKTLQK